jgi:phosphoribosylformylglycinamidine synthase
MLGLMDDLTHQTTLDFKQSGDWVYLIGQSHNDIGCSEYVYSYCQVKLSPAPHFDLETEFQLQQIVKTLIRKGVLASAHDVSDGGLLVALAESMMPRGLGVDLQISLPQAVRADAFWFGESQSRVVVSVSPQQQAVFEAALQQAAFPFQRLGRVAGSAFQVNGETWFDCAEALTWYEQTLPSFLSAKTEG